MYTWIDHVRNDLYPSQKLTVHREAQNLPREPSAALGGEVQYCQAFGVAPSIRGLLDTGRPEDLAQAVRVVQAWQAQEHPSLGEKARADATS
jgi:hypothetical protein